MFSATVSMVDSEINVYAGAVTRDIYARLFHREKDDRHLVRVGRLITVVLGLLVIGVAIAVPHMGGAQSVILSITGLFVGPLVLPTLWGLFSKRVGLEAVFVTVIVGAATSAILKFGLGDLEFFQRHSRIAEVVVGIVPPLLTLVILEFVRIPFGTHQNWERVEKMREHHLTGPVSISSAVPRLIVAWSLVALGALFFLVAVVQSDQRSLLILSGSVLTILGFLTGGLRAFTRPRSLLGTDQHGASSS
jgi:hypothetical protein